MEFDVAYARLSKGTLKYLPFFQVIYELAKHYTE